MIDRRRTPESYAREFDSVTLGNLILNTESELRWQSRKLKALRAAVPLRRDFEREYDRHATSRLRTAPTLNPPRKRKRK
jgi:hypothetical protein